MTTHTFHKQIKEWVKLEQLHGSAVNNFRGGNNELVSQVFSGQALKSVAIVSGINSV